MTRRFQSRFGPLAALIAVFLLKLLVVIQLKDHPLTHADVGLDRSPQAEAPVSERRARP